MSLLFRLDYHSEAYRVWWLLSSQMRFMIGADIRTGTVFFQKAARDDTG